MIRFFVQVDRDTQKCAYKCSHAIIDGKGVDVFKQPITDPGKTSKKGRLTLECNDGVFSTIQHGNGDPKKVYFKLTMMYKFMIIVFLIVAFNFGAITTKIYNFYFLFV